MSVDTSVSKHEIEGTGGSKGIASQLGFWLGFAAFVGILLWGDLDPNRPAVTRMGAVAALMAIWWIPEAAKNSPKVRSIAGGVTK